MSDYTTEDARLLWHHALRQGSALAWVVHRERSNFTVSGITGDLLSGTAELEEDWSPVARFLHSWADRILGEAPVAEPAADPETEGGELRSGSVSAYPIEAWSRYPSTTVYGSLEDLSLSTELSWTEPSSGGRGTIVVTDRWWGDSSLMTGESVHEDYRRALLSAISTIDRKGKEPMSIESKPLGIFVLVDEYETDDSAISRYLGALSQRFGLLPGHLPTSAREIEAAMESLRPVPRRSSQEDEDRFDEVN